MNLDELRSFVVVARMQSFSAAAKVTGIPRSTLSKRVQMLEASLDLLLIERSTRQFRLTQDGELLLAHASRIISDADEIERLLRDRKEEQNGILRVSVPAMFGQELMGRIAADYLSRWPKVKMDVVLTDSHSDLIEESFDCAIRIGPLKDSAHIARCLAWSNRILVAQPKLASKHLALEEPEHLSEWPTISFSPNSSPVPWTMESETRQFELIPQSSLIFNNLHSVREAAIAGAGVAFIPDVFAISALEKGRLIRLLPNWKGLSSSINVIYPSRRHPSTRLRAFIELLNSYFH